MSEAVGTPLGEFPEPVAPIAPEPFVPDVSTPVKLITEMEASTLSDSVAVTATLESGVGEKARQISASPFCAFVLLTSTQVNPAPATLVTVVLGEETLPVETSASNNSLPEFVENEGVAIVLLALEPSAETEASIESALIEMALFVRLKLATGVTAGAAAVTV